MAEYSLCTRLLVAMLNAVPTLGERLPTLVLGPALLVADLFLGLRVWLVLV